MRNILLLAATALAITACDRHGGNNATTSAANATSSRQVATAITPPMRKSGLWEQTMSRDGKPQPMGAVRMCIDAASDAKVSVFGRSAANGLCNQESISRSLDGVYHFASTCSVGKVGTVKSTGAASGDFASDYVVHAQEDVSGSSFGAMNGRHVTDVRARWVGPCPKDMVPGDVIVGGFKMNLGAMAAAGEAIAQ